MRCCRPKPSVIGFHIKTMFGSGCRENQTTLSYIPPVSGKKLNCGMQAQAQNDQCITVQRTSENTQLLWNAPARTDSRNIVTEHELSEWRGLMQDA